MMRGKKKNKKKEQRAMTRLTLILISLMMLASCDDSAEVVSTANEGKTRCEQVADKISECVGGRIPPLNSCSQSISEEILTASCEDVLRLIRGEEL
jgi:hypothetical protein